MESKESTTFQSFSFSASPPNFLTPWRFSSSVFTKISKNPSENSFKRTLIETSEPEFAFLERSFSINPPTNRAIAKVWGVYNWAQSSAFESTIASMEQEALNPVFDPKWPGKKDSLNPLRQKTIERWKEVVRPFNPFLIPQKAGVERSYEKTKVIPMWHGSTGNKCLSICESGFTFFGKHKGGKTESTDDGFFGSGIYLTNSARYAADIYSDGEHLLFAWVSMREPYPVVSDKPGSGGSDMNTLMGKGAYENHNAHYIPVISIDPNNAKCAIYYPCAEGEVPMCDELVVFQKSQTLLQFWVEICVDLPKSMPDFSSSFTVGNFLDLIAQILNQSVIENHSILKNFINGKFMVLMDRLEDEPLNGEDSKLFRLAKRLIEGGQINQFIERQILENIPQKPSEDPKPSKPLEKAEKQAAEETEMVNWGGIKKVATFQSGGTGPFACLSSGNLVTANDTHFRVWTPEGKLIKEIHHGKGNVQQPIATIVAGPNNTFVLRGPTMTKWNVEGELLDTGSLSTGKGNINAASHVSFNWPLSSRYYLTGGSLFDVERMFVQGIGKPTPSVRDKLFNLMPLGSRGLAICDTQGVVHIWKAPLAWPKESIYPPLNDSQFFEIANKWKQTKLFKQSSDTYSWASRILPLGGMQFAIGFVNGWVQLWEGTQMICNLAGKGATSVTHSTTAHPKGVGSLAYSINEKILISGGGEIKLWEVSKFVQAKALGTISHPTQALEILEKGILACTKKELIEVWDIQKPSQPRLIREVTNKNQVQVTSLRSISPTLFASGLEDGEIVLWQFNYPDQVNQSGLLSKHRDAITVLTSTNNLLISGSDDCSIMIWNIENPLYPCHLHILAGHDSMIRSLAVLEEGVALASGSTDGTIKIWSIPYGCFIHTVESRNTGSITTVAKLGNNRFISGYINTLMPGGIILNIWEYYLS